MKGPRQREASQPATDPNLRLLGDKILFVFGLVTGIET